MVSVFCISAATILLNGDSKFDKSFFAHFFA